MATYKNIRVETSESIATLTFDRPAVKNALDLQTVQECHHALDELPKAREHLIYSTKQNSHKATGILWYPCLDCACKKLY